MKQVPQCHAVLLEQLSSLKYQCSSGSGQYLVIVVLVLHLAVPGGLHGTEVLASHQGSIPKKF